MSGDLVERVARAIRESVEPEWYDDGWVLFKDEARAAIRVMVEECARVGVRAVNSCREDGESDLRAARSRVEHYIRALLEDGE